MIKLALERITLGGRVWLDGYIRLEEQPVEVSGANVAEDNVHLYAKDNGGGISRLFYKDDGQVEHEVVTSGSGGGGVTDHGALTGLADDDHAQYLLTTDATSRALFAANWLDLTDLGATTLHSHILDSANFTGTNWVDLTDGGATTLHSHAGGLTGSGTAGRVAFWDGAASLSSDADMTFSVDTLSVDNLTLSAIGSATEGILRAGATTLLHTFGTGNTFVGESAGNLTHTAANFNTGVGTSALAALTTGDFNVAIGRLAGSALTIGGNNVLVGLNCANLLQTGSDNVIIGFAGGGALVSTSNLVAIGASVVQSATTVLETVAIGSSALLGLTTGDYNTAIGSQTLAALTIGEWCTGVGRAALLATTGNNNTGIGFNAGLTNTTGADNTYIGAQADAASGALSNSTAIGRSANVGQSNHIMLGDSAVCVGIAGAARPTGSGGLIFPDGTALSSMASNTAGLYANDVGGTVVMFSINEAGLASQHGPWGVYTPTLTNVANLAASTAYSCQYVRFGNIVTVSGKVDVDPTTTLTATQLGISLPIASDLGAAEDCAGTAFASGIAGQGAAILGDATNNRAEMNWLATDVTNQPMYFQFTYEVI